MLDTDNLQIVVDDDMRIPLRDGITLSARVWRPESKEPLPVILEILPYRKRDGTAARDATTHAHFATHGYVCIRADLRGAGESEGLFDDEYSEQELSDIEDSIAWIAAQSWCSGAVGIMGISWGGFNGLQVAARRPEALKAVISLCSSVDRYADDIHYKGGCQLTENAGWAATAMSWFSMPPDPDLIGDGWREIWMERLENTPSLIGEWIKHSARNDYWKHGSVCEDFAQIEAPVLCIGGWHDGYRNTAAKLLEGQTSGPVKAIMGPWNHKYPHIAAPEPRMDFVHEALRWWDRWLKGAPNGVEDDPAYRVYVMDGIAPETSYTHRPGTWVGLPEWPATQIAHQAYALGDGILGQTGMTAAADVKTNPICGRAFGEFFPFGFGPGELPDDQRHDDALSACFETETMANPLTLLGAPQLQVTVTSNQAFGQMVARLCDVAPDGASTLITFGILNLKFREGFDIARDLVPGKAYDVMLDLDQTAYVLPAGHKLRLAISASYWPFIWPEPGNVTLSITQGSLSLPVLDSNACVPWSPETDLKDSTPVIKQIKPPTENKTLHVANGRDVLTITADHGETAFLDHGLQVASALTEKWSIDHADVTSAHAEIAWTRSMARDDFRASCEVTMTMHCDHQTYFVDARLKAFDDKDCIFDRLFQDAIPRNLQQTTSNDGEETK